MPAHKTIGTRSRLAGHTLPNEGRVHGDDAPFGRARCSCGEASEVLNSDNARKAWHREHKQELVKRGARVKAKLIVAHGGRFGPGRTHLLVKDSVYMEYKSACSGQWFYGDLITGTLDKVDCAHCRRTTVFKELLNAN